MKTLAKPQVRRLVLDRVGSLTLESQRRWGEMTILQMLRHLSGAMEIVLDEGEFPSMRPLSGLVKFIALKTTLPWPKGVATSRDPKAVDIPAADFELWRGKVLAGIDGFGAWSKGPGTPSHPAFGDLTTWEWQRWAYLHADHHLRQFSA
ncbi:MAG: DUF1569 domain-containing protein [Gemmatimonadota bacterium]|nr:DUF1569 domain-containing protein [Gemmatimonadota bacterium]